MATKARRGGSLATILNANTSAASNTVVIDSGGDISLSGSLTVTSGVIGYATNTTLQATFAQNTAIVNVANDRLQVANAAAAYVTKSTALTSNNALVNLINDRYQVANADVKFVTKSVQLTSNNSLVNLINDRIQAANVSTTLGTYWPSANVIAYTNASVAADTKYVNTSIFIATGGENRVAIPYTNTNYMLVYLNGVLLTEDTDYVAANNVHIGGIDPVLAAGDVLLVEEYKNHNANTQNRTPSGGSSFSYQGSSFGYNAGGSNPPATMINVIEKYPFTSDSNSSDVGDLTQAAFSSIGMSSATNGHALGGVSPPYASVTDRFDKWPFASDTNATDVGDMVPVLGSIGSTGQKNSASSADNGYIGGGLRCRIPSGPYVSNIYKYAYSTDTLSDSGADMGLSRPSGTSAAHASTTEGFISGGFSTPPAAWCTRIDKFPFSSDTNSTDAGDLYAFKTNHTGHSSDTHGYAAGGNGGPQTPYVPYARNTIQKFSFTSGSTGTDVADLGTHPYDAMGTSSTSYGYVQGGRQDPASTPNLKPGSSKLQLIQKFPFSSDTNSSCVGDLAQIVVSGTSQQV